MAKNRKHQSAAIRFGPALKAILLCLFIGGSGVGYVWQKSQIAQLGGQLKDRELRLAELERKNGDLRRQYATLCTPANLELRVRQLNLDLVKSQPNQVIQLLEPEVTPPVSASAAAKSVRTERAAGLAMQ
jgi:hypothetical protein